MDRLLTEIGNYIFKSDEPCNADIIFITGGSFPEQAERAAALYHEGRANYIMPSGKYSVHNGHFGGALSKREQYAFDAKTESEFLAKVLMQNGVPSAAIIQEPNAVSTYDNARFSREMLDGKGLTINSALLCCKSMHARRAYMYYQYYFSTAHISVCPVDIAGVTHGNWQESKEGIAIVLSEYEKCALQLAPMLKKQYDIAEGTLKCFL